MADDMIKSLAANGGVIQINFGSGFINEAFNTGYNEVKEMTNEYIKANGLMKNSEEARNYKRELLKKKNLKKAKITEVVDHIDHVVQLVGIDHVGLGSDFDGLGPTLPIGLNDVSQYPNLIYELLRRKYSEEDIKKICAENILRAWSHVENIAKEIQNKPVD